MGFVNLTQVFFLELDGKPVGRIWDVSLPTVHADLVSKSAGVFETSKRIMLRPSDFGFKCSAGMARSFFDWVKGYFESKSLPKNGAIVVADTNQNEKARIEFVDAYLTGVMMPKLKISSADAGLIAVTMSSESIKHVAGGGKLAANPYLTSSYLGSAKFKLSITQLEKQCEAATEISEYQLVTKLTVDYPGDSRVPVLSRSGSSNQEFTVTMPAEQGKAFTDWMAAVIKDPSTAERKGSIEYYYANSKSAYFILDLTAVGITSAKIGGGDAGMEVRLYCDSADFSATSLAIR